MVQTTGLAAVAIEDWVIGDEKCAGRLAEQRVHPRATHSAHSSPDLLDNDEMAVTNCYFADFLNFAQRAR
jgi:hypothetical protein